MHLSRPARWLVALVAASTASVAVSAVGGVSAASAAEAHVSSRSADTSWFVDPRTPAQRRAQVAIPADPKKVGKRLSAAGKRMVETRAAYRTAAGRLAVPMRYSYGHRIVEGQAVTLDKGGLFVIDGTELNSAAKKQLDRVGAAFVDAGAIRCEGYADYTAGSYAVRLSTGRARSVCDYLATVVPGVETTVRGYLGRRPAVLGGTLARRGLNRRVVVEMTQAADTNVNPVLTVPTPPVEPGVVGHSESIEVSFAKSADDGGSPILSYQISFDGGTTWEVFDTSGGGTWWQHTYEGLTNGTTYDVALRAVNAIGASQVVHRSVLVATVPDAPIDLSAQRDGSAVRLTFNPPSDGGSEITDYEVLVDDGDFEVATANDDGHGGVWIDVADQSDSAHSYAVRAVNVVGSGDESTASVDEVEEVVAPDAPEIGMHMVQAHLIAFLVGVEDDGGSAIVALEVEVDGGDPVTVDQPCDEGLTETCFVESGGGYLLVLADQAIGAHTYVVRAVNGASLVSGDSEGYAAYLVGAPTIDDITYDQDGARLRVTPPADGGEEFGGYVVEVDGVALNDWSNPLVPYESDGSWYVDAPGVEDDGHTFQVAVAYTHGTSVKSDLVDTAVTVPSISGGIYDTYAADGFFYVWFPRNTDPAALGYQVSIEGGPWLDVTSMGSDLNYEWWEGNNPACAGVQTCNGYKQVRIRVVTEDGHSLPSAEATMYDDLG